MKLCHLNLVGRKCMSTRVLPMYLRSAYGESVQPQVNLSAFHHMPYFLIHCSCCSCHRYNNALEAPSASFNIQTKREMLRGENELFDKLESPKRHSNSGCLYCVWNSGLRWWVLMHVNGAFYDPKKLVRLKNVRFSADQSVHPYCTPTEIYSMV